jgi:hypothetical protein
MSQFTVLAYLDHNILDSMLKGDPAGIADLLRDENISPVFSSENLAEIHRSKGREIEFLQLLDGLEALHLVPVMGTGTAELKTNCASNVYQDYVAGLSDSPDSGLIFTGMLEKLYGGRKEQSFAEIFACGVDEIQKLLSVVESQTDNIPGLSPDQRDELQFAIQNLPDLLRAELRSAASSLDTQQNAGAKQFEDATGLGAKVLKNVEGPRVVRKIWAMLEKQFDGADLDIDTFFGTKPSRHEADFGKERTVVEKVNGIYHQLNFLGYYRDSKMHQERRFKASFSDMTHAGLASFCHLLICRDGDLVMKAAAAYEYLRIDTKILHYKANQ